MTIIKIAMQTQVKFPSIPKLSSSPKTKIIFLRLSLWDDELLSTPKVITFH